MDRDFYGVLGVRITASEAEIRHAFREVAKRRHPDINRNDPDASRKFMEARQAEETLLDPRRRAVYDARVRLVAPTPPSPPEAPWPEPSPVPRPAPEAATKPPAMSAFGVMWRTALAVCGIGAAIALLVATPRKHNGQIGSVNGTIMWKVTGFRLNDGWGINLAGQGTRLQVFPGASTDLEVDSGYLSSAGRISFLPRGAAPTYEECLSAVQHTSDQAQPLDEIKPAAHGDLCSSGASGDVAFIRVTRADSSGMSIDITVWKNI